MTVGVPCSNGAILMAPASSDSPRNTPSPVPMSTSVWQALRQAGSRKAGTPLEIASTPVTAAPPSEGVEHAEDPGAVEQRVELRAPVDVALDLGPHHRQVAGQVLPTARAPAARAC